MVAAVAVLHQISVMVTGDMVYFVSSRESVCIAWVPTNLTCDRVTRVISVISGSCRQTACAMPAMSFSSSSSWVWKKRLRGLLRQNVRVSDQKRT